MSRTLQSQSITDSPNRAGRAVYEQALANQLFDDARRAAGWHRFWSAITRRPARLRALAEAQGSRVLSARHFAGVSSVPIAEIRGSENGHADFDPAFRPLNERVRGRWVSVFRALANGLPLPPVELVHLGETYFVRDGHHRVSVARALGQESIDAEVTVLEVAAQTALPKLTVPSNCECRAVC